MSPRAWFSATVLAVIFWGAILAFVPGAWAWFIGDGHKLIILGFILLFISIMMVLMLVNGRIVEATVALLALLLLLMMAREGWGPVHLFG